MSLLCVPRVGLSWSHWPAFQSSVSVHRWPHFRWATALPTCMSYLALIVHEATALRLSPACSCLSPFPRPPMCRAHAAQFCASQRALLTCCRWPLQPNTAHIVVVTVCSGKHSVTPPRRYHLGSITVCAIVQAVCTYVSFRMPMLSHVPCASIELPLAATFGNCTLPIAWFYHTYCTLPRLAA